MWVREHSTLVKNIKKETLWNIWKNVNDWPTWHSDLDFCQLHDEFKVGHYFMLKPKNVSPVKIILTEIRENESFTDCTHFFGAKMHDTHSIEETPEGLVIKNRITVTGPLRWLWIKLVAQHVAASVPEETNALVRLAEKNNE